MPQIILWKVGVGGLGWWPAEFSGSKTYLSPAKFTLGWNWAGLSVAKFLGSQMYIWTHKGVEGNRYQLSKTNIVSQPK